MMRAGRGILFCLCLISVSISWGAQGPSSNLPPVSRPASPPASDEPLKAAMMDAQKNLGELEPWQKLIFKDEVVPQYQRFIRSHSGMNVEIDYQSLRRYLIFYAPKILRQKNPQILVVLKSEKSCTFCSESSPALVQLIKSRLERRGLNPIWMNLDDQDPRFLNRHSSAIIDQLLLNAKQKNTAGLLYVEWSAVPVEDLDSAHADEKNFRINLFLSLNGITQQKRQKELYETDSFEAAEARMLTDLFTDLGAKLESDQALLSGGASEEILIEVSGFRDFAQYSRIKTSIQTYLSDSIGIEERQFAKGKVVFAVYTKKSAEDLKRLMSTADLDPSSRGTLTVVVK